MTERDRLLIVNQGAGSVDDTLMDRLRREFAGYRELPFPPDHDFPRKLRPNSVVVACGGDGTIAAVARALAGSGHVLGILAMGTFNNFARGLGLPTDIEDAIAVIKTGEARPVTLGRANGAEFLEAASIGFFGDTIALGEAAKDLHYGEVLERARTAAVSRGFRFRVSGDLDLRGTAVSIIAANTPSIGALVPVGGSSPEEPHLELVVNRGRSRLAMAGSFLAALVRRRPPPAVETYRVRQVEVATEPPMTVYADASEAGGTPLRLQAWPAGLTVILPRAR